MERSMPARQCRSSRRCLKGGSASIPNNGCGFSDAGSKVLKQDALAVDQDIWGCEELTAAEKRAAVIPDATERRSGVHKRKINQYAGFRVRAGACHQAGASGPDPLGAPRNDGMGNFNSRLNQHRKCTTDVLKVPLHEDWRATFAPIGYAFQNGPPGSASPK